MYFLKDTKQEGNKVRSITSTPTVTTEILFENGNKYTYDGTENLYFNKILICSNITSFKITEDLEEDYGKTVLKVEMTIGESVYSSNRYEKTTEYVMTTKSNISSIPVEDSYIDNIKGYTVTFDSNGGNMLAYSKTLNIGEIYGNMPISAKDSSTFMGWYTAKEDGIKVEESTTMNRAEDHTLYAQYAIKVTLSTNRSSVTPNEIYVKQGQTYGSGKYLVNGVLIGLSNGSLPDPSPTPVDGYYFEGWHYDQTRVDSNTIMQATTNHTLTANWIEPHIINGNIANVTITIRHRTAVGGYVGGSYVPGQVSEEEYDRYVYKGGIISLENHSQSWVRWWS